MILVTGGAGYIGSHCVLELLKNNCEVVIFDNLSTGHFSTVEKLQSFSPDLKFEKGDLRNIEDIKQVFQKYKIDGVLHFAAFSQVEESIKNPQKYYLNNVVGSLNLFIAMIENEINHLIFSSTAAVYGTPDYVPIDENHPKNPINTYGKTKLMIEQMLEDFDKTSNLKSVRLRYFNVAGANSDELLGENHSPETHLIPNILCSSITNNTFKMYGNNYKTRDGSCIRDYINVEDLAKAHVLALKYIMNGNSSVVLNLGTENGSSVKEIFALCEKTLNTKIPLEVCPPRVGDCAVLVADYSKAKKILDWQPQKTLEESINSAYNWHKKSI